MHELLLYGHLPPGRATQVLNVLAGLTAMQPQPVMEKHLLFKPSEGRLNAAVSARQPHQGGSQKVVDPQKAAAAAARAAAKVGFDDTHYFHLCRVVDVTEGDGVGDGEGKGEVVWTKRVEEVPDPGHTAYLLRHVRYEELTLPEGDELKEKMGKDGFTPAASYTLEGSRFILNNTVLMLYQILPDGSSEQLRKEQSYLLEAKIRLSDGTNPRLVKMGQQELDSFRERMKGIVAMKAPDRLSLDTRAR